LRPESLGGASAFHEARAQLLRPLAFAASDEFAALAKMPDLARDVRRACSHFDSLALPEDLLGRVRGLAGDFAPGISGSALRASVGRAIAQLEPWSKPEFVEGLLARPVSVLSGVGPKRAKLLASRGIRTVSDLVFYLPTRYDDRRALAKLCDLEVGRRATFIGEIKSVDRKSPRSGGRRGRTLTAVIGDETGSINLKWFRSAGAVEKDLERGALFLVTGDVKRYRFSMEIVHPELERIDTTGETKDEADAPADVGFDQTSDRHRNIVPHYPTPEGIPPRTLRKLIRSAVDAYSDLVEGCLPESLTTRRGLPEPGDALRRVHAPDLHADLSSYEAFGSTAHERLVLEELYLLQLGLVLRRAARVQIPGIAIDVALARVRAAPQSLPFALTSAQARVWREIAADLAQPHPMNRLLQGDVGSGKTAIALLAAVAVAANGRQVALMAPTELLAEQHCRSIQVLSGANQRILGLRIGLLTASLPRAEAADVLAALAEGEIDLMIGTHALIQHKVVFRDLALAIVDEQHRFGVLQRASLMAGATGSSAPHVLVMTATPIPRTLALTGYGDLDLSVIDELPPGRSPTRTLGMGAGDGARIMEIIRDTVARGEQVYVVYPLVEESEKLDLRSAMESAERIDAAFPELQVDLLHGRLDSERRGRVMDRFARGQIDILVATTVIEVGVDVANASLMIIEHAERFGLAQLHQLRGRVGRGAASGTCLLVSRGGGEDARARLDAMLRTSDGFEIADADLEIRGPGEFLGTRQSGDLADLRMADLVRDAALVELAREAAIETLAADPGLRREPRLMRAVEAHWGERLALIRVG
jgi:ATP-dependent DNA helicase RecG